MGERQFPPQPPALPPDLPPPVDDGSGSHLEGSAVPHLSLTSTQGTEVDLGDLAVGGIVLYVFPKMGRPGEEDPTGWAETPGAYGCTQQSCAFRDRHREFSELGYSVAGASAQTSAEQTEAAQRLHLAFPLFADPTLRLRAELELPTFSIAGTTLYKRLTFVAKEGLIRKVFYPVFPPDENPEQVLHWIKQGVDPD